MAKLVWDKIGTRRYETGVDRGVLYIAGQSAVAWNGLVSVSENPNGGSAKPYYLDGVKILNIPSSEEYESTLEAFTYPDQFALCDGTAAPYSGFLITAQPRRPFGFSYRTLVENDLGSQGMNYKIHLVYNALAEPSTRDFKTIAEGTDTANFSWKITAKPQAVLGFKPTAHFVIDSRLTDPLTLDAIEKILYGDTSETARLPLPDELMNIYMTNSSFVVVDNGDGSWTATGTEFEVIDNGDGTFILNTGNATIVDSETYTLSSP